MTFDDSGDDPDHSLDPAVGRHTCRGKGETWKVDGAVLQALCV